ncbi:hypothetical protein WR25_01296 [Diploscapter pachys]|uniref:Cytoplasmic polyadenylation element-binding protein 1 n=1 Tax=Diploscapter pachys TaxID=2018661 RepID=A0A2A2J318_9BILA|nr:hypothetical protein WR25_01296 [Diploscapter pachys]
MHSSSFSYNNLARQLMQNPYGLPPPIPTSLLDMDTVSLSMSMSNLGLTPPISAPSPISTTVAQSSHHLASLVPSSLGLATSSLLRPPRVSPGVPSTLLKFEQQEEIYARKVFVGGLPIDITSEEIYSTFQVFGNVVVDWPRRPENANRNNALHDDDIMNQLMGGGGHKTARSMTGYVFLVFEEELAVQRLVKACHMEGDRYYLFVSSPTMRDKPVQIRPWRLSDIDFVPHPKMELDPRRTVFIGGVPRPTRARELAECLEKIYGSVAYVGIDIDPELKYPKGAARVTFSTTAAFVHAIAGRYVNVFHSDSQKRVEIKPYVLDEQYCDECDGKRCENRYAPYFCGDVGCLQYYCYACWDAIHERPNSKRSNHKPLVRMGDQTKVCHVPFHRNKQTNNNTLSRHMTARPPIQVHYVVPATSFNFPFSSRPSPPSSSTHNTFLTPPNSANDNQQKFFP